MKKETLEQAAKEAYEEHDMCGDVGKFAGINKMLPEDIAKYFHGDGFIAGASWREQQDQKNDLLDFVVSEVAGIKLIPSIWINNPCAVVSPQASSLLVKLNASYHESAKLLAEKDAEIKMLRDLSVKSCVCLKLSDELFKAKELLAEKDAEIERLKLQIEWRIPDDRQTLIRIKEPINQHLAQNAHEASLNLEKAKELIKEMRDALLSIGRYGLMEFDSKDARRLAYSDKIKALLGEE